MISPANIYSSCSSAAEAVSNGASSVPEPIVKIDNHTDAFATIVTIEFGDILGDLADTVRPMWMRHHCFVLQLLLI